MRSVVAAMLCALALPSAFSARLHAQYNEKYSNTDCGKLPNRNETMECTLTRSTTRIIKLTNVTQQADANEILVTIRNMFDPGIKIYLLASQEEIVVNSYPEQLDRIEALVHALDKPHRVLRITFAVTRTDTPTRSAPQHFTLNAMDGQRASLMRGPRYPVVTGILSSDASVPPPQVQYQNAGWTFDVTPTETAAGVVLKMKIDESIATPQTGLYHDPIFHRSTLESVTVVPLNKPTVVGAIESGPDGPRWEASVLVEPLP